MSKAGRPTKLDHKLLVKIRHHILEGATLTEVSKELKIPYDTIEGWATRNYNGFRDKLAQYRLERRVGQAERFSDDLMKLLAIDEEGKVDPRLLKIQQDEAKFLRETLAKELYSKRTDSVMLNIDAKDLEESKKAELDKILEINNESDEKEKTTTKPDTGQGNKDEPSTKES